MVYGALVMPRTRYRSKVQSIDDSEARKIPGFIKAVKVDDSMGKCTGWVVAVAEKFPAAVKAAQALKVQVDPGPYGGLGSNDLFAEFAQKTKDPAAGSNWDSRVTSTRLSREPRRSWKWSTPPTWCATRPWSRSMQRCNSSTVPGTSTVERRAHPSRE